MKRIDPILRFTPSTVLTPSRLWTASVFLTTLILCVTLAFCQERKQSDSEQLFRAMLQQEGVKTYPVDKRIADFPEEPGLEPPENAYATQKFKIAATITDKELLKKYREQFIVREVILAEESAGVFGYREYDKLYDFDMFLKKENKWIHQGNFQADTPEAIVDQVKDFRPADESVPGAKQPANATDDGFVTGGVVPGLTHIVVFKPTGDFNPQNPGEFLAPIRQAMNASPKIGYFRTKAVEGKLVGSFLTEDPVTFEQFINSIAGIEFIRSERLTQESFDAYAKTIQESLPNQRMLEIEKSDWYGKLNEQQKVYVKWDENQFAYIYDANNYVTEEEDVEERWLAELAKPEPGHPGRKLVEYDRAIFGLAMMKSDKALKPLVKIAAERVMKDNAHRHYATKALGILGDPAAVPELIPLVYHFNWNTRWEAQVALVRLTGQNFGADYKAWGEWYIANKDKLGKDLPDFDPAFVDWSCGSTDAEMLKHCDPAFQKERDAAQYETETGKRSREPSREPGTVSPIVIKMEPANGAQDVDASAVKELRVTFDIDMNRGGYSWCGGGETYPKTTDKAKWIDKRTCVLPVALEPGKTYRLGINAPSFRNFKSAEGIPVVPVEYSFKTKE